MSDWKNNFYAQIISEIEEREKEVDLLKKKIQELERDDNYSIKSEIFLLKTKMNNLIEELNSRKDYLKNFEEARPFPRSENSWAIWVFICFMAISLLFFFIAFF